VHHRREPHGEEPVSGRRPGRERSRGQTLTEFALVVPILLLLFMGILDLGRAAYTLNTVSDAARNGVREAIVNQDCSAIATRARSVAAAVDLSGSSAVQVTIWKSPTPSGASETCAGGLAGNYGIGYLAEVRVNTTFTAITPIIGSFIGPLPLTSTARLPIERAYP
jgi:Flp pilus assembly protein TadG